MDTSTVKPLTYFRSCLILFLPDFGFYVTLLILFLAFGGQHDAILGVNNLCTNPIPMRGSISEVPRVVLHLTDLHLLEDETRKVHRNLRRFQEDILPAWAPLIHSVVVSGDLVHAIPPHQRFLGKHSRQSNKEWELADDFLLAIDHNIRGKVHVTHGNHDTFGGSISFHDHVFGVSDLVNPPKSSVRKYTSDDRLVIYAVDATLSRPFHRPFNFFGDASNVSAQLAADLDASDEEQQDVLVFSHYPTAVQKDGAKIRAAAYSLTNSPRIKAHLSGHLHNIHGFSRHGLAAISKSGNGMLELETPDMSAAGAYRIVVFDSQGIVSTTVSFVEPRPHEAFLHDAVVLSPPRAGLCPQGAGDLALKSGAIRVLSPRVDLESSRVQAFVDGVSMGSFKRTEEKEGENSDRCIVCHHIYYVPYDVEKYKTGVHKLVLSVAENSNNNGNNILNSTQEYMFSMDGSPDTHLRVLIQRITSALLAFSKFDTMVELLNSSALVLSFSLAFSRIVEARGNRSSKMIFAILALNSVGFLLGMPLLMGWNFVEKEGWGIVTLRENPHIVDTPYLFARWLSWSSWLPTTYLLTVIDIKAQQSICEGEGGEKFKNMVRLASAIYALRALGWCREVLGSYGIGAVILSPTCLPWATFSVWCLSRANRILKNIPYKKTERKAQ